MAGLNMQPGDRALRVVSAGTIDYGRNKPAGPNIRQNVIPRITGTVAGMEACQAGRNNPVDARSLASGVFYEHRTLPLPQMVSTPFLTHLDLLSQDPDVRAAALVPLRRRFLPNNEVLHHPVYQGISTREFSIFNLQIDGGWIVVFIRIQRIDNAEMFWNPAQEKWYQFEVQEIAFIDPRDNPGAVQRLTRTYDAVRGILEQGSIRLDVHNVQYHWIEFEGCGNAPELTGYWAYAINREFMRRFRILTLQRPRVGLAPTGLQNMPNVPDDFWLNWREPWNVDILRQAMLGADALRGVQQSNYQAYIALIVPSDQARQGLADLQPPQNLHVMYPDEWFQGYDNEGPPLVLAALPHLPGGGLPGGAPPAGGPPAGGPPAGGPPAGGPPAGGPPFGGPPTGGPPTGSPPAGSTPAGSTPAGSPPGMPPSPLSGGSWSIDGIAMSGGSMSGGSWSINGIAMSGSSMSGGSMSGGNPGSRDPSGGNAGSGPSISYQPAPDVEMSDSAPSEDPATGPAIIPDDSRLSSGRKRLRGVLSEPGSSGQASKRHRGNRSHGSQR
ncbi:hypothetical protein F4810DRAFT_103554 [Camillea tinctor]|nr:hypothetical protein F4810DRAFT_103554 [Camillea tinctor]